MTVAVRPVVLCIEADMEGRHIRKGDNRAGLRTGEDGEQLERLLARRRGLKRDNSSTNFASVAPESDPYRIHYPGFD